MYALLANLLGDGTDGAESGGMRVYFILAGGFLIIAITMLRNVRRRMARSAEHDKLSVAERVSLAKPAHDVHSQIGELMAELAGLSRQINGQLDTRMARLEILLAQADRAIEKMSGEAVASTQIDKLERPTPLTAAAEQRNHEKKPAPAERVNHVTALEKKIVEMAERGVAVRQISQEMGRPAGEIELILALKGRRDID